MGEFNAQGLANTAWAFAMMDFLETSMVSSISKEVLERIQER